MKYTFYFAMLLSVVLNVSLLITKIKHDRQFDDHQRLFLINDISHKDGFASYKKQIGDDNIKTSVIYFWDSLQFENYRKGMLNLDSLASISGKHTFNYFFVTEMDQVAAEKFIVRSGMHFKNFKIIGDADDFMSGVYNEKPAPNDAYFRNGVQIIEKKPTSKRKGYYFLMNQSGTILYYNYKHVLPSQDSAFVNKLKSITPKDLNYEAIL